MTTTYGFADTSYLAAGSATGIQRLVERFYQEMSDNQTPAIQAVLAMHPADLTQSIDKLTCFLIGWMGGPREYADRYGPVNIPQVHRHLTVGDAERDAWLACMQAAVDAQPYEDSFKIYLMKQLAFPAERIRQTAQGTSQ